MFAVAGYHAVVCDAFICFCFESHFYEYGGSKFHHVVDFPAIVLPGGNPHYIGYKRLCKHTFTSFFPGRIHEGNFYYMYIVNFPVGNSSMEIS